jgi:hypothetical protein
VALIGRHIILCLAFSSLLFDAGSGPGSGMVRGKGIVLEVVDQDKQVQGDQGPVVQVDGF